MKKIVLILLLFLSVTYVKAQTATDDFSDGDFTANPSWSGDVNEFMINASHQLQTNNTIAGASYLSTASPSTSIANTQWTFYIKQTFAPSSSNYGRVYLASDQANLESTTLNGYYLQFGEALSNDAVELFCQTGATSVSVCRGTNAQIANSFSIGIKVTRDSAGLWSLYVDPTGGTAYALETTATDNTFTLSNFYGVATVYTLSNATKFFFDDFNIGPIVVDTTPPTIVSATPTLDSTLDVLFNEPVDLATSSIASNYSLNALGSPTSASRDGSNFSLVHLSFPFIFTSGVLNTLTITNVQDLSGNAITSSSVTFIYVAPSVASYKNVVINEIMADPTPVVGLPNAEFIELYNKSNNTFDLNGWTFTDGSSTATIGSFVLSPGQYLVLCSSGYDTLFNTSIPVIGVGSFPALNNSGDNLKLYNSSPVPTLIDSVNYSDTWYQDAVKKLGGWTLELINPNAPAGCPASNNWIASNNANGGTPGIQNSVYSTAVDVTPPSIIAVTAVDSLHINVCFSEALNSSAIALSSNYSINNSIGTPTADTVNSMFTCVYLTLNTPLTQTLTYTISFSNLGDCSGNPLNPTNATFTYYKPKQFDVVINEIMVDPTPIYSSLPDAEYVELFNTTHYAISLNNWSFSAGTNTKLLPDVTILPDSFIVFANTNVSSNFPANYNVVGVTSFPALTNTGQTLTLKTPDGGIISSVSYTDAWYRDNIKKDGGWSIEQIDPRNPCEGMNNWHASISTDAGTPGRKNSVYADNPDNTPPKLLRVAVIAVDTIQLYFNEPLDSATMLNPAVYFIDHGINYPSQVKPIAPDYTSVRLTLATSLVNDIIYTVTVNNAITDCVGNPIGLNNSARFAIPKPAVAGDIVINEILFDPNVPGVDYVEIYNNSNKVIDLKTLKISQFDTINNAILNPEVINTDGYLFFPQQYIVLSENGNTVKAQYYTPNPEGFVDVGNLPSMNISGGTVCLSFGPTIIDNFTYYPDMHFPLLNSTKGVSLERIDFNRLTQDRTNWHSAAQNVGFGTPAYKNSQYSDAGQSDTEVEISPEIFSPDEDGHNDVVNINYHFDAPGYTANVSVYDSKGKPVKLIARNELLGTQGTLSWDGINEDREKSRLGIYIIYFEAFNLKGDVKRIKKTCVLATKL